MNISIIFNKKFCAVTAITLLTISCQQSNKDYQTWDKYKGDAASSSYSGLDQINRDNVSQLEVAWIYNSGDIRNSGSQVNPIIIDGVMYLTTAGIKVVALDAANGEPIWIFDPFEGEEPVSVNRGVTYWEQNNDKRIFIAARNFIYALDAETGTLISEFGNGGSVDMREGLGRVPSQLTVHSTTPGIIHKNLLIMGSGQFGDVRRRGTAPGHIRAYNTITGEMEWIFHTIPHPGEFGYETWGVDAWQLAGGANNWGGMSLDEEREIVFASTGSPAHDFYTPETRGPGQHLFGNSVLALDANTGERIWHYQTLQHELWDYDLPSPPNLVTIERNGKQIDAVAQVSKHGFTYVLNRESGEPVFPVNDRPVPQSDIKGEQSWPTQPFPEKPEPFVRQHITENDLTDISPEAREYALQRFRELKYEGIFTPPGEQETLTFPGTRGGAVWGGASFDPESGILYVNANEYGTTVALEKIYDTSVNEKNPFVLGQNFYLTNCSSCHGNPLDTRPAATEFPSLAKVEEKYTGLQIKDIIENGRGSGMPASPHLAEAEKEAIIEYLFNVDKVEESAEPVGEITEDTYFYYGTQYAYRPFVDQNGYPATKPPWGSLNAIDLNTGEFAWKVPLGEFEELTEQGIPVTGTYNMGGSIVTAGGLVFIGATADEKFRAFDKETGEILWEYDLPAVGYAIPSTYEVDGRQYVVIAANGGTRIVKGKDNKSDAFIAFALTGKK